MYRSELKSTVSGGSRRWFVASLALAALMMGGTVPARAAAVQFATFSQTLGNPFQFSNLGGVATTTFAAAAQTKFNFTLATGLSTADRDATIIMSGSTTAVAISAAGFVFQPINGAVNSIQIIENSTGKNLLTMLFNGTIAGMAGTTNASLAGDTVTGNTVSYTSDYLTFGGNPASYLIGLPTVTPALGITGSFLTSFVSNAQGSFSGTFNAVPAPTSIAMFGTGIFATLALARRRNRKNLADLGATEPS